MAHYAQVVNNIVVGVFVWAEGEQPSDGDGVRWIQTSYNTHAGIHYDPSTGAPSQDQSKALRKNYAGIGFTYSDELDAFIPPKDDWNASWVLDAVSCVWVAPIQKPIDGRNYVWDESRRAWALSSYPDDGPQTQEGM